MSVEIPELTQYSAEEWKVATHTSAAIAHYKNIIDNSSTSTAFEAKIRIDRHKNWLRAAMATVLNKADAQSICLFWSQCADTHIKECHKHADAEQVGLGIFALGKLGAEELNLSSDVDVMFVTKEAPDESAFKCAKKIIALLAENTGHRFVHRVDADLRPGGRLAPLVCSVKQMQDYYWSNGETWERLALTRLRPVCSPPALSNEVLLLCKQFSFRKFIDYSLLNDLKLLRQQIQHFNGTKNSDGFHLKLAAGGIRDIELFVHSLMIIHGGRNPELQTHSTSKAIQLLLKNNIFPEGELDFLLKTYWHYRTLENLVQASNDEQVHIWKDETPENSLKEIRRLAAEVDRIVENVIGKTADLPGVPEKLEEQRAWLKGLGFNERTCEELWPKIMSLTALSTRSIEHEISRKQVLYKFVNEIATHALDKQLALELLIEFLRSIRAKASFFSTLLREQNLIAELAILFGQSPYMGQTIASRPELLDALLQPQSVGADTPWNIFLDRLSEEKLIDEIIATKEFLKSFDVTTLSARLTTTADSIVAKIFTRLKTELNVADIEIIALGKWGGRELGFRSDLDFIFVCENEITPEHHKLAKRFISRMTEQNKGGQLYSLDMRLRPSGKAGPVIVQIESLHEYLKTSAATWEKQSYLKARAITGQAVDVLSDIFANAINQTDLNELSDIREKLLRIQDTTMDLKYTPGGVIDIELAVQAALLQLRIKPQGTSTQEMLFALSKGAPEWKTSGNDILKSYLFLRRIEQLHQIVSMQSGSELSRNSGATQRVARLQNMSTEELFSLLSSTLNKTDTQLKQLDPRRHKK